jgi:hypothetical protein
VISWISEYSIFLQKDPLRDPSCCVACVEARCERRANSPPLQGGENNGYCSHVFGIPFIISPAAGTPAAGKRLFCSANAAQQRHNVAFVLVDGAFEGGVAITAGRRVSGKRIIIEHKISSKFKVYVRTWSLHPRQLWLQSAAGTLPCNHDRQRDAERCVGH